MNAIPADPASSRSNNFDALRFILALVVMYHHICWGFTDNADLDLVWRLTGRQIESGSIAVNGFFAISGYLIALSWSRTARFWPYMRKRAVRILPGYYVAALLCLFIVAPLGGADPSAIFAPIIVLKSLVQTLLLSMPEVPGTFSTLATGGTNASLWTIRHEFQCYLLVPILMMWGRRLGRWMVLACFVTVLSFHLFTQFYEVRPVTVRLLGDVVFAVPRLLTYFLAGMVFAQFKDVIPFRRSWAFVSLVILLITGMWTGGLHLAMTTLGVYLLFYVAFERVIPLSNFGKHGDFSYGLYLYGWPVQQLLLLSIGPERLSPATLFCLTMLATLSLAILSWRLVESPFLRRPPTATHRPTFSISSPPAPADAVRPGGPPDSSAAHSTGNTMDERGHFAFVFRQT